ncbi:phage/plasmid primase, P4 family [Acidithiobacillus sulfuriphilus]|uniref:phage/plasmid primase, P4 family n=1 Tax=Acidithiobacillus sulfuriphilus TaxID=1867749 RepID=UPI003F63E5BC
MGGEPFRVTGKRKGRKRDPETTTPTKARLIMTQIATSTNELPALLKPKRGNIPAALQALGWGLSDPIVPDGRSAKAPRDAAGRPLSPASSVGWLSFLVAGAAVDSGRFGSFGARLDGSGIIGIDLDHFDEKAAEYPRLAEIVEAALKRGLYFEKSPSGTGRRAFVFGKLPAAGVRKSSMGVEVYSDKRYLRVTGWKHKASSEITADQQFVDDLLALIGRGDDVIPALPAANGTAASAELVERTAERVSQREPYLWAGNLAVACDSTGQPYGASEADLALCRVIANAGVELGAEITQVPDLIERVMGQSGLAQIEHGDGSQKWLERADYCERTIRTVCAGLEASPVVLRKEAGVSANAAGDIALAERFAAVYRGRLLWVPELSQWLAWSSTVWSACVSGEEIQAAKAVLFQLVDEAREVIASGDQERGSAMMKAALAAQKDTRIRAMLHLAKAEPGMSRSVIELDADAHLLGVQNGSVNLRTGELLEARPEQLISRQCAANYTPDAECPTWLRFLNDIFEGDQSLIGSVQRLLGYTLTGENTEEVMVIAHGGGANGKSVFHNVVSAILGDYTTDAPADLLVTRPNGGGATPELAMLAGRRMVGMNELNAGARLDSQRLKWIAGRERITARNLYAGFFSFQPSFTAWLRTNFKPVITDTDYGTWRRLVVVPFLRSFTEGERDLGLEARLLHERDAIISWMVSGAAQWYRGGLQLCARLKREVTAYRQESDLLGLFLDECSEREPSARVPQRTLYAAWQSWCLEVGVRPTAKASFTRRLSELGHGELKSNGQRFYGGLRMSVAGLVPPPVPHS